MKELILPIISSIVSAVFTFVFTRRKNNAEVKSAELDNIDKALGIYRKIATDLEDEILSLRREMISLKESNTMLSAKLDEAHKENGALKSKLENLERKLNEIKNFQNKQS